MKQLIKASFMLLLATSLMGLHPVYVGMINIEYNYEEKKLEINTKLFVDDLEACLKKETKNAKLDVIASASDQALKSVLLDYFEKNLKISLDKKPIQIQIFGYEIDKDAVWVYLYADDVQEMKKAEVKATLLFSYKKSQVNIVTFEAGGKKIAQKATYSQPKVKFDF